MQVNNNFQNPAQKEILTRSKTMREWDYVGDSPMPRPTRAQINIKLTDQDSILVERFRMGAITRGWGFKQAVLDALEKWLENPPPSPPTPVDSLGVVMSRLDALEAKLIEIGDHKQETMPSVTRSMVEQLRERTSTQSLAIALLQQEVKVLREQVSGLEAAVLSLACPQDTIQDSQGDRQDAIPDITPDITPPPERKYLLCPECLARGFCEESFTEAGKTKGGQSRWKCNSCDSIKVESKLIATPPFTRVSLTKKPYDLTLEEIEKLSPWKQWEAVCTDMIDGLSWEDLGNGSN